MMRVLKALLLIAMIFCFVGKANAMILTFDDPGSLGVTLGGSMEWNGTGGGHIFAEQYWDDDFIYFSAPTYVTDFQMNAWPWQNYDYTSGRYMDIAGFDSGDNQLWNTTVDLANYTSWDDWLTVSVGTGNISKLAFYSPANAPYSESNGFWPSIDNMRVEEYSSNGVPEPATMLLFSTGLLGTFLRKRRA